MQALWLSAILFAPAAAQFGFFDQIFRQEQQQQQRNRPQRQEGDTVLEESYYQFDCPKFLCEDTLACVDSPVDCPCPFQSEIKCVFPDKKSYVCISEPSNEEGPTCDTVLAAWNGDI